MATLGLTDEESEEYDSSCSGSTPEWLYEIHQNFLEGKILPYQYEPLRSDYKPSQSDAEDEDDSPESEMETEPENRMEDLASWCKCGHCEIMPTNKECVCCVEDKKIVAKNKETGREGCITTHPGFQSVCLNHWVLQVAYRPPEDSESEDEPEDEPEDTPTHEKYMDTSYKQLIRWCGGYVGEKIRVVLPACVVKKVQKEFTPEEKPGSKYPKLK